MMEYLNSQLNTMECTWRALMGHWSFWVPFCLTKLKGGVNAYDIADAIIQGFIDVIDLRNYAYTEIIQYFNDASMDNEPLLLQHHLTTLNWEHYWKLMSYKKKSVLQFPQTFPLVIW